MNATTVAVDLAKSVFQLAVADSHWRLVESSKRHVPRTFARCASSRLNSRPCRVCSAFAVCGWERAPAASTPCAASVVSLAEKKFEVPPPRVACELIDHHGQPGSPHID